MGNSLTDGINNNIREGINIISGPNGLISVVRDSVNGTISAYKHTVNGLVNVYTDTEQNFFSTANNIQQNVSNIVFDTEKGVIRDFRATEKDIVTMLDDQGDQIQYFFRSNTNKMWDTIQWIISLGFLGFLLILILFGKDILNIIDHIIKNGIKVTF